MLRYGVYCDECGQEVRPGTTKTELKYNLKIGSRLIPTTLNIGELCENCKHKIISEGVELKDYTIE